MKNIISITRKQLGLSQSEFGEWLAKQKGVSRETPFPFQHISMMERGLRSPRKNIRQACAPIAAKALANDAVAAVERTHLHDITSFDTLPPDLRCVRDDIADWMAVLIAD